MLKIVASVVVSFVLIFGILGVVAPKDFRLEREIVIHKPKDLVFNQIKQLKNQFQWNAWLLKDPKVAFQFQGDDGKKGFLVSWTSENPEVGTAEQEIMDVVDGQRVETQIRFKEPFEAKFRVYYTTEVVGENRTMVTSGMADHLEFPRNVFHFIYNVCLGNEKKLIQNMDETLANLKTTLEKKEPI